MFAWTVQRICLAPTQVIETARPYDVSPITDEAPRAYCCPFAGHSFVDPFGSTAGLGPVPFTIDNVSDIDLLIRPSARSVGITPNTFPIIGHEYESPHNASLSNSSSASQLQTPRLFESSSIGRTAVRNTRRKRKRASANSSPNGQSELTTPINNRELTWVNHGQKVPGARILRAQTYSDQDRKEAIKDKGGVCGPCRISRKQCDASDHCALCIRRNIPSEARLMTSPQSVPGIQKISLSNLESSPSFTDRRSAENHPATHSTVQKRTIDHVKSWFENATKSIDSQPFKNDRFQRQISLDITSGVNRQTRTRFNLDFLDISRHLESRADPLEGEALADSLLRHSSARTPLTPTSDQPRSCIVTELSAIVSHTFAFLKSLANANIYASIPEMSAAHATISIIYASLYRLLLAKSDALCSIVLKSLQKDFDDYCIRRKSIDNLLRGIAQYHRVVNGLANWEPNSPSEPGVFVPQLGECAKLLLRGRGIRELLLRIRAMSKKATAIAPDGSAESIFDRIMSNYSTEVPEIHCLNIVVRVHSSDNEKAPVPTQAMRDTDPYHHRKPIRVQRLLNHNGDWGIKYQQLFVDDLVNDFDRLQRTSLEQPGPSDSCPSFLDSSDVFMYGTYGAVQNVPTSLEPEHASTQPSQQDTATASITSDVTAWNDPVLDDFQFMDEILSGEPAKNGRQDVADDKHGKRREGSGDSLHSHLTTGYTQGKYDGLAYGRNSPPLLDPFDYWVDEPGAL